MFRFRFQLLAVVFILSVIPSISFGQCEKNQLSQGLQNFITDEQSFESSIVPEWINTELPKWDSPYAYQRGAVFPIQGCWFSIHELKGLGKTEVFYTPGNPLISQFMRQSPQDGPEVLFFIHPAATQDYKNLGIDSLDPRRCASFCATPTSSNRTVLVWTSEPSQFSPVMIKTSLNMMGGGRIKSVTSQEAEVSVKMNTDLEGLQTRYPELQKHFRWMREPFSIQFQSNNSPKHPFSKDGSGMIVRQIPDEIINGTRRIIPALALFGQSTNRENEASPYLLKAVREGKIGDIRQFILSNMIRPFVSEWLRLTILWGIVPEPHSQNLLVDLDPQTFLPTGKFWHRDLYGFALNQGVKPSPSYQLPFYRETTPIQQSIAMLFNGIFLYQMRHHLSNYGVYRHSISRLEEDLYDELMTQLKTIYGFDFDVKNNWPSPLRERWRWDWDREHTAILGRFQDLSDVITFFQRMKMEDHSVRYQCTENYEPEAWVWEYGFEFLVRAGFCLGDHFYCDESLEGILPAFGNEAAAKLTTSCEKKLCQFRREKMKNCQNFSK